MAITKHSSVHPLSSQEKDFVIDLPVGKDDFSPASLKNPPTPPQSRTEAKRVVSHESLTPSTVEVIMNGGHFGMAGPKAYEAAMWCGLGCFFICGIILIVGGIYTVVTH